MNGRGWQAAALERFVSDSAGAPWPEHRCAHLGNPAAEREIDAILLGELWPGVGQALAGSRFVALVGDDGDPGRAIRTLHREFVTGQLTAVIEDPEDPSLPGSIRPWYCRFDIEASVDGYLVHRTTILSFPEDFDMARLTRFPPETAHGGLSADAELVGGHRRRRRV